MSPSAGPVGGRVTVILPVYNAGQFLRQCLESLLVQGLDDDDLEVVIIDDGSTDDGPAIIESIASGRTHWQVVRQPNSGWPGGPRNRGIERSTGEYLFFLDADDWLAPGALRAMRDYAREHGVDVVVPRLTPAGGAREYAQFTGVHDPADLRDAYASLTPQKLVRRELLERHQIRFPEGEVRLEDAIFVTRVFVHAERVAILGDGEFYTKRRRDDRGNLTFRSGRLDDYFASLRTIAEILRQECDDPDLAADLILTLYRKKALWRLRREKIASYRRRHRKQLVKQIANFAGEFVDRPLQQRLPLRPRLLSEFARRRDIDALLALAEVDNQAELDLQPQPDGTVLWTAPGGRRVDVTAVA